MGGAFDPGLPSATESYLGSLSIICYLSRQMRHRRREPMPAEAVVCARMRKRECTSGNQWHAHDRDCQSFYRLAQAGQVSAPARLISGFSGRRLPVQPGGPGSIGLYEEHALARPCSDNLCKVLIVAEGSYCWAGQPLERGCAAICINGIPALKSERRTSANPAKTRLSWLDWRVRTQTPH